MCSISRGTNLLALLLLFSAPAATVDASERGDKKSSRTTFAQEGPNAQERSIRRKRQKRAKKARRTHDLQDIVDTEELARLAGLRVLRQTNVAGLSEVLTLGNGKGEWTADGFFALHKEMEYPLPELVDLAMEGRVNRSLAVGELSGVSGRITFVMASLLDFEGEGLIPGSDVPVRGFLILRRGTNLDRLVKEARAVSAEARGLKSKYDKQIFTQSAGGCEQGCDIERGLARAICDDLYDACDGGCAVGALICAVGCAPLNTLCLAACTAAYETCRQGCGFARQICYNSADDEHQQCIQDCVDAVSSPILVDLDGHGGIKLGPVDPDAVAFDIDADGAKERVSWTVYNTGDAFLARDRNHDGAITDGSELFGNFTPLVDGTLPEHGFQALAEFDLQEHGGNDNNRIDEGDLVFQELLFWLDANRNGISENSELHSVSSQGVKWISLNIVESAKRDKHGNFFRFSSNVRIRIDGQERNTRASDVFLVTEEVN